MCALMVPETDLNRFAGPIILVIVNVMFYKRSVIVYERGFFFGRNGKKYSTRSGNNTRVHVRRVTCVRTQFPSRLLGVYS